MHFDELRLIVLRKEGRIGEALATENGRVSLYAHLRTYTQPAQLFAAGAQLAAQSQPALQTGLMAPAWRPALFI